MPELTPAEFEDRLPGLFARAADRRDRRGALAHYRFLLRWNRQTSLVGPGTIDEAVETHYGESLAALPLLGDAEGKTIVDIGSGAGFPGFVLAAARPARTPGSGRGTRA